MQFAGDLLDCVTDFERLVTVWESEAGEQLSDLIKIGVVVKGLEKGNFRDHLLINTSGTKQWSRFIKELEAVELERLNSGTDTDGLVSSARSAQEIRW